MTGTEPPLADDRLKQEVRRWSQRVGRFARGKRIQEDPTAGGAQ
ncbi:MULTISPECIES: hypothetical protein [unclassified Micromonospora]